MANFFSADYWKALYFKAMGGQETAVDPNSMSGSFAGVASFTGTLEEPEGFIAGSFTGGSAFEGSLSYVQQGLVYVVGGGSREHRKREEWLRIARQVWAARQAAARAKALREDEEEAERLRIEAEEAEAAIEQAAQEAADTYEARLAERSALLRLLDVTKRAREAEQVRRIKAEREAQDSAVAYITKQIEQNNQARRLAEAQQAIEAALELKRRQDEEVILLLLMAA